MEKSSVAIALLAVAGVLRATPVAAHPGPGAPPEFVLGECIDVVDERESQALELKYNVAFDDVTFGLGEIQLPESKTHLFFSFTGAVVKTPGSTGYQLFPFDPGVEQPLAMPMWLDQDDVDRAAGAAGPVDMTGFMTNQVVEGDVLADRADVAAYLSRFAGQSAGVPITEEQARMGAHWDLTDIPAGVYQVGGYVFSPPFNDWAMRPGVIKVIDGQTDVPAVVVEPIDSFLYAGQGKLIHGCVNAAPGSTLSTWVRAEDQPGAAWEPWLSDQPLDGDRFELCWPNSLPGRDAIMRVRVVVTAPDGQRSAAYSPDTLVTLTTVAKCTPSATVCCPEGETAATPMMTAADAGSATSETGSAAAGGAGASNAGAAVAGTGEAPMPQGGAGAPGADDDDAREPPAGTAVGSSPDDSADGDGGACAVRAHSRSRAAAWLLLLALALLRRRYGRSYTRT